ncbi:MAG: bifunctional methylenetetrahydrofolate dehydrogenase/methenyltetrahydrofolate cyclohydrolase FolD [Paludibacteraceae bacterium]|nr:bifunctional methylenetetrahydrofolate dehydrogenase/methenyltetrahydrofolate cyclohydrolase FolD [Paludibacteraceae bacterium]
MILSGTQIAQSLREEMREQIAVLRDGGRRAPCLAIVLVGENAASEKYVGNKLRAAEKTGMTTRLVRLPQSVEQEELISRIAALNEDSGVDGIIVQLPLPEHISAEAVIAAIAPHKDADGLHPLNEARLWRGQKGIRPCTPQGVVYLLDKAGVAIDGKRAVVVGRGDLAGKPIAKMLLDRHATVTMAHSHTRNLPSLCREADILVSAAGQAGLITADCVKEGAAVIDVGISVTEEGKMVGDVCFDEVAKKAAWITPVPGGVGPMTIAMLLLNTLQCYLNKNH